MNWIDVAILAFVGFFVYRAYRNGFVRELVALCSVILAIPLAGAMYDDLYPKVHPIVDEERLAYLVSFLAIFLGVVIGGQVAGHLLKQSVRLLNLGAADALAGGAFGLLKGVLIVQTVVLALVMFPRPDVRNGIDDSSLGRRLLDGSPLLLLFLPERFDDGVERFLSGVDRLAGDGVQAGQTDTE